MAKSRREFVDPEEERFYQKYPKFPGVETFLVLLKSPQAKGVWIDLICMELRDRAGDDVNATISAFRRETSDWAKSLLLYSIALARVPEFLPLFAEVLSGEHEEFRSTARLGLEKIGTKEARAILWQFSLTR